MNVRVINVALLAAFSLPAFADRGTCVGYTRRGEAVRVTYANGGYTGEDIDAIYRGFIKVGASSGEAEYEFLLGQSHLVGDATEKSRRSGRNFGTARLRLSQDYKTMTGVIGREELSTLNCTHHP